MVKIQKMLSLDKEIFEHIQKSNINFSEWVSREWTKQFMSEDLILDKIKELNKELEDMHQRKEALQVGITSSEKRFLLDIPRLIADGKDWSALKDRFNIMFNRSYDLSTFKKTVKFLEAKEHDAQRS